MGCVSGTINLVKLNAFNDADTRISNQRVIRRTQAWDIAEYAAGILKKIVPATAPAMKQAIFGQITDLARATGFWSVWMTVFKNKNIDNGDIWELLVHNNAKKIIGTGQILSFPAPT